MIREAIKNICFAENYIKKVAIRQGLFTFCSVYLLTVEIHLTNVHAFLKSLFSLFSDRQLDESTTGAPQSRSRIRRDDDENLPPMIVRREADGGKKNSFSKDI